ncbi:putative phosphoglycerate mutase pmu1 [Marasmius crinis-equi]|uniref:Phosphoglycerate mutase pmu1 n=1 Tax=Marasmius crinis-equi TaxID=585013 RepID=A0ABR3EWA6_9AGAR
MYNRWLFVSLFIVLIQLQKALSFSAMTPCSRNYTFVPGFFIQDNSSTADANESNNELFDAQVPPRFGLIDSSDNRWAALQDQIRKLNRDSPSNERHKLVIFARHGQGFHNVAETKYGTQAWDDYWSKLDGDGEIVWGPDAELTPTGEDQARAVNVAWKDELEFDIPLPKKRYSSPMTRALSTYNLTFEGIQLPDHTKPLVLENAREVYGVHTCDMRRSRTYIRTTFPRFDIEKGFTEEDELWTPDVRESDAHVAGRAKSVLDVIFENQDDDSIVSVTAHSGIINGFLTSVGRPSFSLQTGGVLPMVVKAVETYSN